MKRYETKMPKYAIICWSFFVAPNSIINTIIHSNPRISKYISNFFLQKTQYKATPRLQRPTGY